MPINSNYFGFTVGPRIARASDSTCFVLSESAKSTLELVAKIYFGGRIAESQSITWLLRYRQQIREIERRKCGGVLSRIVEFTPETRLRILAIWLLGRCGGTVGTKRMARFITTKHFKTRKELARALRRKHAWADLRALLLIENNPRIIRFIQTDKQTAFDTRLKRYAQSSTFLAVQSPVSSVFLAKDVDVGGGKPAKSRWLIRSVLHRIHRLVSIRGGL